MAILMSTLIHANNTHMTSRYKKTKPKLGLFNSVELAIGLEPTTTGLQNQGSTIELRQHCTMHNIVFLFFLLLFFSKSLKFGKVPQFADNRCLQQYKAFAQVMLLVVGNICAGDVSCSCQHLRR